MDQLSIFIDVALTASDDDLTTIKLGALKIVGNAIVGFIKEMDNIEQLHDQDLAEPEDRSQRMIKLCDMLQTSLDQHNQLPDFLVSYGIHYC